MRNRFRVQRLVAALALGLLVIPGAQGREIIDEGRWVPKPPLPDEMYRPPPAPGATAPSIRGSSVRSMSADEMRKLQQAAYRPGGDLPLPTLHMPQIWIAGAPDSSTLLAQLAGAVTELASTPNKEGRHGVSANLGGVDNAIGDLCSGKPAIVLADRPMNARERALCKDAAVSVLEVPALQRPSVFVVNARNDWVGTILSQEALVALFTARKGHLTRWNELDEKYPDAPVKLYIPYPGDASMSRLADLLGIDLTGAIGTRLGDVRTIAEAIAFDRNGLGWVPGDLARSSRLRRITVTGRDGTALEAGLAKALILYINAGGVPETAYAAVATRVLQSVTGLGPAIGADALAGELRAESLARLAQGRGGYVSAPDWTGADMLRASALKYQD